ncbi:hypothetical protein [Acinetobacter faecalis]|uniref:hypothetical protein n=1 Tax=Acinetobacter faecalis TaxID=2665161 RepID=UPI002A913CD7|nr:hypothetical protein [Acinetobacter faecalis]MDY6451287.1 hypothetical protein [Acinetobacter faecalis]
MNQEIILKILIAIISSLVMIFLTYIFKRRQLYVATENLYRTSEISNKGVLCEISIFNRGRQIEEDIKVSLDNSLKYELLAFNDSNMSLDKNIIKISRLHKKSKVSVLLLVENGDFTHKQIIQVDSKTEKGKVIKNVEEVPPNLFDLILGFLLLLPFIVVSAWAGYIYKDTSDTKISLDNKIKFIENGEYYVSNENLKLKKMGWLNLIDYEGSKLSKSYFGTEFPIRFLEKKSLEDGRVIFAFELINKTALPFRVSVDIADKSFIQEMENRIQFYNSIDDIQPLSKKLLVTKPINIEKYKKLDFSITTKGTSYDETETIYNLIYKIDQ